MESQKKLRSMKLKIRNRAPGKVDMDCLVDTYPYQSKNFDKEPEYQDSLTGSPEEKCPGYPDSSAGPAEKPAIELDEDILDRLDLLACLFHNHPVE
jgi:hypothetical protein